MSNIMYGSRTISSFELVHGYTPKIKDLPKIQISTGLLKAHKEQVAMGTRYGFLNFGGLEFRISKCKRRGIESMKSTSSSVAGIKAVLNGN